MDAYDKLTKKELVRKVNDMTILIDLLIKEKNRDELSNFPWTGNLGNWYWDVKNNIVICNDQKFLVLGYSRDELPMKLDFQFFTTKLHPEDYNRVMDNMSQHLRGLTPAYEVEYRIQAKNGEYKWFYDRGKIVNHDSDGKPLFVSGIVFDITEQKKMDTILAEQNLKLLELVNIDHLTQIFNRKALLEKLEFEISNAHRSKSPLSILMLDIDFFKNVNDSYGHLVGDHVLIQTSDIIKNSIRTSDILGRYGGEEFLVILPDSDLEKALLISERIRKKIETNDFTDGIHLTISGGLKLCHSESIDQLVNAADTLLYEAKKSGRNRIVYQSSEL